MIIHFIKLAKEDDIDIFDGGDIKLLKIAEDAGFDPQTGELRVQTRQRTYRRGS